ncbi:AI-2E family transporter [Rhodobacteraceae bacterium NNCM2]|nr:AI-2E family transporter [Coraliihabitans acroporae]
MAYLHVIIGAAATLWVLVEARGVLQPIVIAGVIWFVLKAMARLMTRYTVGPDVPPTRWAKGISALLSVGVIFMLGTMVASNATDIRNSLPVYEANLDQLISSIASAFGQTHSVKVGELVQKIDMSSAALGFAGSAAGIISSIIIIVFYIVFIFVEDGVVQNKLTILVPDPTRRGEINALMSRITHEIERYLGIKVILGIIQAIPTFLVLILLGVDGAVFWAILVFFFSFIPTIGTLVGIIFPALMTLMQFDEMGPFITVVLILGTVQILVSNLLEPRMMGRSLNLSPLAIFISIFAGGAIWGIVGALIIVPILAVVMIVCASVPSLRPIAVILSSDGDVH